MITVLHLTSVPAGIGGVERLLVDMARHYDRGLFRFVFCNLFRSGPRGRFGDALRAEGAAVYDAALPPLAEVLAAPVRVAHVFRRERVDIVHTHTYHANIIGQVVARILGARSVLTRHYGAIVRPNAGRIAYGLGELPCFLTPHLVAVSSGVKQVLVQGGHRPEKIRVIENGIDLRTFDPALARATAEHARPPSAPVRVGCVASLRGYKGLNHLIEAARILASDGLEFEVEFVGEGPDREALRAQAAAAGLGDRVIWSGFQNDVTTRLVTFDVYAQPSLDEAFGLAAVEAMAARMPVVASRTGGLAGIVDHEMTGLLVPPGDAAELAVALRRLITDARLRRTLGTRGRAKVENRYTIDRVVREYENLYAEIAALMTRAC